MYAYSSDERLLERIRNNNPTAEEIYIHWAGVASYILQFSSGKIIYLDPYFSDIIGKTHGLNRIFPPPFNVEELEPDLVFISHNHLDHCDPETLARMKGFRKTIFIVAADCCEVLKEIGIGNHQIALVKPGDKYIFGELSFIILPSWHLPPKNPKPMAIGTIICAGKSNLYFAGDTLYEIPVVEAVKKTGLEIDIAILPINGAGGTMPASDAAHMAGSIEAKMLIPSHYGLFYESSGDPYHVAYWLKRYEIKTELVIIPYAGTYRHKIKPK